MIDLQSTSNQANLSRKIWNFLTGLQAAAALIFQANLLKVSKFQNEFMMSSFLPKNERNVLRISALASKKRSDQKNKGTLYH